MTYRNLQPGEPLQIADEYRSGKQWHALSQRDYRLWVGYASHYDPETMAVFRRPLQKQPQMARLSRQIFEQETMNSVKVA
jgi:hypothetical protein